MFHNLHRWTQDTQGWSSPSLAPSPPSPNHPACLPGIMPIPGWALYLQPHLRPLSQATVTQHLVCPVLSPGWHLSQGSRAWQVPSEPPSSVSTAREQPGLDRCPDFRGDNAHRAKDPFLDGNLSQRRQCPPKTYPWSCSCSPPPLGWRPSITPVLAHMAISLSFLPTKYLFPPTSFFIPLATPQFQPSSPHAPCTALLHLTVPSPRSPGYLGSHLFPLCPGLLLCDMEIMARPSEGSWN